MLTIVMLNVTLYLLICGISTYPGVHGEELSSLRIVLELLRQEEPQRHDECAFHLGQRYKKLKILRPSLTFEGWGALGKIKK
jgi:hypothetical protein